MYVYIYILIYCALKNYILLSVVSVLNIADVSFCRQWFASIYKTAWLCAKAAKIYIIISVKI